MTTRNAWGVYQNSYTREILDAVKRLEERGDTYKEIATQIKHQFKLSHFTKNNVAGMINRLRRRGELPPTQRKGGVRTKGTTADFDRPPAPITLAKV